MNSPIAYSPEQAAEILRAHGANISAETIRDQAQENPELLGFPVCVINRRVLIPKKTFNRYWFIE